MQHLVPEGELRDVFVHRMPRRIEIEIRESGIADVMPDGMRLTKLYHVEQRDDDHAAMWSEYICSTIPISPAPMTRS
jgi:hypothetical protein